MCSGDTSPDDADLGSSDGSLGLVDVSNTLRRRRGGREVEEMVRCWISRFDLFKISRAGRQNRI